MCVGSGWSAPGISVIYRMCREWVGVPYRELVLHGISSVGRTERRTFSDK